MIGNLMPMRGWVPPLSHREQLAALVERWREHFKATDAFTGSDAEDLFGELDALVEHWAKKPADTGEPPK
jgi:hypothetical protein